MRTERHLHFGTAVLSRNRCPKCGDEAIFRNGKCVRTGCGYVLKQYKNLKIWESDIERGRRYRRERMRIHRAIVSGKKARANDG